MRLYKRTKNTNIPVLKHILDFVPRHLILQSIKKHNSDKGCSKYKTYDQFVALSFGQLCKCYTLSDISCGLSVSQKFLDDIGLSQSPAKSTMSDGNKNRAWEVFETLYYKLLSYHKSQLQKSHQSHIIEEIKDKSIKLVDSTTISLCLTMFDWAKFRTAKGGLKIHTLFDILTSIPIYNIITDHNIRDQSIMDYFEYEPNAFYVFDKAYVKLLSLSKIDDIGGYFVVRRKKKMNFEIIEEYDCDRREDGILRELKIVLSNRWAKARYKKHLRLIYYYCNDKKCVLEFFTNNMDLDAYKITQLYKCRWQIELYFKWIKQHLRIKQFYGTSENAVKIQIYIGIIAYCLIALIGAEYKSKMTPFEILRMLSVSLFEKVNLREFISNAESVNNLQSVSSFNLTLF